MASRQMIISRDEIETFIPERGARLVILGTMGAISARTIDGQKPRDAFFYHNARNHLWKILQLIFEPNLAPAKMSVAEKMQFLNKWRIAMANIVAEIEVEKDDAEDPSDAILFKAHRGGRLKFKTASADFKKLLTSTPLFFTCRAQKEIVRFLDAYLAHNGIDSSAGKKIWYLPTPTRCSPVARSALWKSEIETHIQTLNSVR